MSNLFARIDRAISRLNSSEPEFDDCAEAVAIIEQMRTEIVGPDGYATWREAATSERGKRVQLEAKLAAAEADAERWKLVRDRLWIRSQVSLAGGEPRPALEVIIGCAFMDQPPKSPGRGDELDSAIDAARGAP